MSTKPKPSTADEQPAAKAEAKPKTVTCWNCGQQKTAPPEPGAEQYETDASGNVLVNTFCEHCGKGEPVAVVA